MSDRQPQDDPTLTEAIIHLENMRFEPAERAALLRQREAKLRAEGPESVEFADRLGKGALEPERKVAILDLALASMRAVNRNPDAWGTRNLRSGVVTGALVLQDDLVVFHDEEIVGLYAFPSSGERSE